MAGHVDRPIRLRVSRYVWGLTAAALLAVGGSTSEGTGGSRRDDQTIKPPPPEEVWPPRAVWVVRRAYDSQEQIADVMEQAREAGRFVEMAR